MLDPGDLFNMWCLSSSSASQELQNNVIPTVLVFRIASQQIKSFQNWIAETYSLTCAVLQLKSALECKPHVGKLLHQYCIPCPASKWQKWLEVCVSTDPPSNLPVSSIMFYYLLFCDTQSIIKTMENISHSKNLACILRKSFRRKSSSSVRYF